MLLKTGLLRKFYSEKLLQIGEKINFNKNILLRKVAKNWRSVISLFIEHFSSTPLR